MNEENKTLLLVDWENIRLAAHDAGWGVDLATFGSSIEAKIGRSIHEGVLVSPVFEAGSERSSEVHAAHAMGYVTATRLVPSHYSNRENGMRGACNLDAEVCVEALRRHNNFDTVVLCTGDGDFAPLIEDLRARGKTVWCVGSYRNTSDRLRELVGGRFVPLESLRGTAEFRERRIIEKPLFPNRYSDHDTAFYPLLETHVHEGAGMVVDVQGLNSQARREGWRLSLHRLVEQAASQLRATPEVSLVVPSNSPFTDGIQHMAARQNWRMVEFTATELKAPAGIAISLELYRMAERCGTVVLASGAGEHFRMMKEIARTGRGIRVASPIAGTAKRLLGMVGERFIDVNEVSCGRRSFAPPRQTGPKHDI